MTSGNSSSVLLYVHRDPTDYLGRGTQDVHLDLHTAPELCSGNKDCFPFIDTGDQGTPTGVLAEWFRPNLAGHRPGQSCCRISAVLG